MIKKIAFSGILSRYLLTSFSTVALLCTIYSSSLYAAWQQPPTEFAGNSNLQGDIASDASGHAFTVYSNSSALTIDASYYSSGFWSASQPIGLSDGRPLNINIDMDDTGTALVLWYDSTVGDIQSAHYNGTVWDTPALNPLSIITALVNSNPAVSMNGPNQGVSSWGDSNTGLMYASFFSGTNWTAPTTIATGQNVAKNDVAYSSNGTAVAIWVTDTSVLAANYIGGVWQLPVTLDTNIDFTDISVGIDSIGRAHAIWTNISGAVIVSSFNGTVWLPSQALSASAGNDGTYIGVAPGGTAVAIWVDSSGVGQSSAFNGIAWSAPFQYTDGPVSPDANNHSSNTVSVDNNGNALAVWSTLDLLSEIRSARLTLGALAWCPEELISIVEDEETSVLAIGSLSSNGTGFALFSPLVEGVGFFASASLPLAAPGNVAVRSCTTKFATQTDRSYVITWTASTDPTILYYEVRQNGILVATIPSDGPFVYAIHNLCRGVPLTDVYTITAVGCGNEVSVPVTVVLP